MGKIIMVIIIILWVFNGIIGILVDENKMLVNWFMVIFMVFIPFIPFIASWCGLY